MGKIFISYRRKDAHFVHRLAEKLQECVAGIVFIDRNITEDDFEQAILKQVRECNVFVLAVTENTFATERISDEGDWIRREIALALELSKPIALALHEGQTTPSPDHLPQNIREIITKQALWLYLSLFDDSVRNFAQHCVNISNGGITLKSAQQAIEAKPAPISNTIVSAATGGVAVHTMSGGTINQNMDLRRQDAAALIQLLRQERAEYERQLALLQSSESTNGVTMDGWLFRITAGLIVAGLAFAIHPIVGLAAIGGAIMFFTINRQELASQSEQRDYEASRIYQHISQIDQKIAENHKIVSSSS